MMHRCHCRLCGRPHRTERDHLADVALGMRQGPLLALAAVLLFGLSTPIAKLLLGRTDPVLLASLLYLGSGIGLAAWRLSGRSHRSETQLSRGDWPWLAGAVLAGGVVAPVLLLVGLSRTSAASASLLLNLEGVFTALLAWFVFRENFDRRIALGMAAIIAGGFVLTWGGSFILSAVLGPLMIAGACLAWAVDNNVTRKVSQADPVQIALLKGCVAGVVNVGIAFALGSVLPPLGALGAAVVVGFAGYGVSLVLFVVALRHIGTARTGA